jgi:hypothetical protein
MAKKTKTEMIAKATAQAMEALASMEIPKTQTVEAWVASITGTRKLPEGSFETFRNLRERGITIKREVFISSPREMMARMDLLKEWANTHFGHEKVRITRDGWLIFPV